VGPMARALLSRPPRRRARAPAIIAAEIRLYSLAHVCWGLPPGRVLETRRFRWQQRPAIPSTQVSSGAKGIRNRG
jgi:hypothetical protein